MLNSNETSYINSDNSNLDSEYVTEDATLHSMSKILKESKKRIKTKITMSN